ncbi:Monovalent cation/proton antiporter, MnhD/PhaD subunit, partial [Pseudomonas syringae pv. maculicola]
MNQLIIAPILL